MIAYIRGTLEEISESFVVVEAGGIGYNVYITGRDAGNLVRTGTEVKLYTYFNVREDAMQLFGFLSRDDLSVFRMLLGVSGIGPKAAMGILSALSPNDLRFAVLADDIKTISAAPGVGKKTAQKLVLELKDKFDLQEAFEEKLADAAGGPAADTTDENISEAVQALVALGYSGGDALRAVKAAAVRAGMSTEELLRAALKQM